MPELAPAPDLWSRHPVRVGHIERLRAQITLLELQLRQQVNALTREDTEFGFRRFVGDELAVVLAESPQTAQNLVDQAQRFCEFPAVMAKVAACLPELGGLSGSGWSVRHADAVLDEIGGIGLTGEQQEQVVDLVCSRDSARTPHQLRKATQAAVLMIDPDAAERRYDKVRRDRHVGSYEQCNGAATFWATGPKSQIAMLTASIDALLGPAEPDETRTLTQRRFDTLMDLVCGRTQPGPFQAYVVASLAALTGEPLPGDPVPGDPVPGEPVPAEPVPAEPVPAEIPGLGLITAAEAREVLVNASLRRAVVDEHGELVSLDTTVQHPDRAPETPQPLTPERRLTAQTEPDQVDEPDPADPENPSQQDLTWLHAQHQQDSTVARLTSHLEQQLTTLLREHPLVPAGTACDRQTPAPAEVAHWQHGSGPGPGPGPTPKTEPPPTDRPPQPNNPDPEPAPDPDPDPEPEPEPEPPSFSDLDWHDRTLDRNAQDAQLPRPHYRREPDPPHRTPPAPAPAWTPTGLQHAVRKLLTTPLDPRPLSSTAYALPPRMARFIKTRDHTCTFPSCYKLVQHCQNDHVIPYPAGPTAPHNITSECTHHHQSKTVGYFTVTRDPTGTVHWTTPSGHTIPRHPRPLLRGW